MCGIAGVLNTDGAPVDPLQLEAMAAAMVHRGPDDGGIAVEGNVGLAHRRLSIIDVAGGAQPMATDGGALRITFNGEIFNYVELRHDLVARGHRFRTRSDTEVILHLYQEHGENCVRLLNGQWAFAIWDATRRRLFLSRDRMGIRPLFYTKTAAGSFVFASEIKALFQHPRVQREIDFEALDQIFTFWTTVCPRTIFANIFELPPGHSMTVTADGVRQQCYWRPTYEIDTAWTNGRCAERLLDLLTDATRIRLRADVPVGAYLSGGIDSTVTTALAKQATSSPVRTFSITFADRDFDESAYQREATERLGTAHTAFHCSDSDVAAVFPDVIRHAETPVLRTAPAPMFLLSRLVREQGYKVVVTGEGADEILAGYDIFKEAKIRRFWSVYPESTFRPLLLHRLYPYIGGLQAQPAAYLRAFFRVSDRDCANPFFSHLPRWATTSRLKVFYSDAVRTRLNGYDAVDVLRQALPSEFARWNHLAQAQYLETAYLLPGYILSSQGDRMAMANSVEGRFPFLDHRVVDFASSLPPDVKLKVLDEKAILKRAVRDFIPQSIAARKKQPYRAPDAKCFLPPSGCCPDYVGELLSPENLRRDGIFNAAAVARLVAKARNGGPMAAADNMAIVGVLSTELVVHQFLRTLPYAKHSDRGASVRRREFLVRAGD